MTYVLWDRFLKHNPADPKWPDRDRFVLSAGHASMLLYSLLYLTGYPGITLDDIKNFRQWGARRPATRSTASCRASRRRPARSDRASRQPSAWRSPSASSAATFNRPGHDIVDHHTYVLASDGDMQEGISHEAASFAGHQRLGEADLPLRRQPGPARWPDRPRVHRGRRRRASRRTAGTCSASMAWTPTQVDCGAARRAGRAERPSLIVARTHIGYGSPNKQDTQQGARQRRSARKRCALTKRAYGWPEDKQFYVPGRGARALPRGARPRRASAEREWDARFDAYAAAYPGRSARSFRDALGGQTARRLGGRAAVVHARRQADRDARRIGPDARTPSPRRCRC